METPTGSSTEPTEEEWVARSGAAIGTVEASELDAALREITETQDV